MPLNFRDTSAVDITAGSPTGRATASGHRSGSVFAGLAAVSAVGVLIIALAFSGARENRSWADPALWIGMLVIVLPVTLRLLGDRASRRERMGLVVLLALTLYAVPVALSPDQFVLHDELGAYRSVADILRTGTLYSPPNPVDSAYSAYPGIVSATAALSRVSGLGIVTCGLVLIGLAKTVTVVGLFLFLERAVQSARIAGIALALYAGNPNFVYFDGQFAYESLALGLAALSLWMMSRAADREHGRWTDGVLCAALDAALVMTHHLTSYAVTIAFCLWPVAASRRSGSLALRRTLVLAVFSLTITLDYFVLHRSATESDIGGSIVRSFQGVYEVVSGATAGKAPFTSALGYSNSFLEQAAGLASVLLLAVAWPFGLFVSWRERRRGPGVAFLGLIALLYPASLALRLTGGGSETSNRTSEFVFVGLAGALALSLVALLDRRFDGSSRWLQRSLRALALIYVGVVFVGGITVGNPSYDMLPGSYLVGADNRSIDAEGVAAAHWVGRRLPAGHEFLADEADTELVTAYSRLRPQSGNVHGVGIGETLVAPTYSAKVRNIIETDKLSYLIIDQRDSTALPHSGHYFDSADPKSYSAPIPVRALAKFNRVSCIDRIFSSGNVVIYGTGRVVHGCG